MEKEVGDFLCELDPQVFVIDCLPNMKGPDVAARAEPLVRQLRAARPDDTDPAGRRPHLRKRPIHRFPAGSSSRQPARTPQGLRVVDQ